MPAYPVPAPVGVWMVSDDTQMTPALHDALVEVTAFDNIPAVTDSIVRHLIKWELDPDNFRAPGLTCMGSLANLRGGANWYDAGGARKSAGCGAVMRLVHAAFAPEPSFSGGEITHKHPRAIVPALLLADAVRHAPERHGRFLEFICSGRGRPNLRRRQRVAERSIPCRRPRPAPRKRVVCAGKGLNDGLVDILIAAVETCDRLDQIPQSEFGDPCAGIGDRGDPPVPQPWPCSSPIWPRDPTMASRR